MTIVVTGATGQVGRHVVRGLVKAGAPVRAVTRRPDRAGLPAGVEVYEGDLETPDSLRTALTGAESLYLFPVPETAGEVVDLAKRSGVRRIVVLSSSSVVEEGSHSGEHHLAVERAVRDSGLEWTFVRGDEFAVNVLWKWGETIRAGGPVRAPYGDAVRVLVHEADVAAVAVTGLLTDRLLGAAPVVTGPEQLTQAEQVRIIGEVLGRELRFEEVTPQEGRAVMLRGMPEPVVDMVLGILADALVRPPRVTPGLEELLGRPARTFAEWVADHAADFS
ncbi:NAD(P)H-binding protein [Streptomyces sp. NPDC051172]|uniref:NAD(P)H-binding protein n=1 Tax=Streptomyces sp. NPDC051172 TaxID=3155796 RepID=UPI003443D98B